MKRILWAVLLAILFHAFLFTLDPERLYGNKSIKIKKPAVTVTMSYIRKRKPEPPPVKKILPKIQEKKKVSSVEKVQEPEPDKKQVSGPSITEDVIKEEVEEKEFVTENILNEEMDEAAGPIEETAVAVITEAMPLYRKNPEPEYPRMAKRRRYEGTVILSVLVNKSGMVDNLWILESSGYKILDNAALGTVKEWTFEPGRRGNEPIDMWVEVPVRFELK